MINKGDLKKNLYEITNENDLAEVKSKFNNPVFVIFTDWYKAPFSFRLKSPLSNKVSYWPDSMVTELWNPVLNKVTKGLIISDERADAIVALRSFEQNYRRYGIPLIAYVVEKQDASIFDRNNKPIKEIDPEAEEKREMKIKLAKEKNKKLDIDMELHQKSYDQLFSYLAFMASLYLEKLIYRDQSVKKEFNKMSLEFKRYLYMNIMWIFTMDKNIISKALKIDLSVAQVKNIYKNNLWDYTKNYFDNGGKLKFDSNLPIIEDKRLKSLIHKYSELFEDTNLQIAIFSENEVFKKDLFLDLNDLKLTNEELKFDSQNSLAVPTAKSIDKIDTKDAMVNIENIIKGYVFYARETIQAFIKSLKTRK